MQWNALHSTAVELYALTHRKEVRGLYDWTDSEAKNVAYACRRRLLPHRTYLSSDHLGFHYDPLVTCWTWRNRRLWSDWRERERQQREHGRARMTCGVKMGSDDYCALPASHEGKHQGFSEVHA